MIYGADEKDWIPSAFNSTVIEFGIAWEADTKRHKQH
jgi:hypothetical protein